MSLETTIARIAELNSLLPAPAAPPIVAPPSGGGTSFASQLRAATTAGASGPSGQAGGGRPVSRGARSASARRRWGRTILRASPSIDPLSPLPNGPGVTPSPGDLIIWDEHMGIVESVLPDGRVRTIEGNSSDQVTQRVHEAGSALGYVRMS